MLYYVPIKITIGSAGFIEFIARFIDFVTEDDVIVYFGVFHCLFISKIIYTVALNTFCCYKYYILVRTKICKYFIRYTSMISFIHENGKMLFRNCFCYISCIYLYSLIVPFQL